MLLVCAGELRLSCQEDLTCAVRKSEAVLSCRAGAVQSAGGGNRAKEVEVGAGDCASVTVGLGVCYAEDCEDAFFEMSTQ